MTLTQDNQRHGYRDYDVRGCGNIFRACVPHNIKNGETFNIYRDGGIKESCEWNRNIEASLRAHLFVGLSVDELNNMKCRVCGCTNYDCRQCIAKTGKPCSWVEPGLCSACDQSNISLTNKNQSDMDFFKQIFPLMDGLEKTTITIQKKGDKLTIGFLPQVKDERVNEKLSLLSVTGTPEELDTEFFSSVTKVSDAITAVTTNVDKVTKEISEAKPTKPAAKKAPAKKKPAPAKKAAAPAKKHSGQKALDKAKATVKKATKPAPAKKAAAPAKKHSGQKALDKAKATVKKATKPAPEKKAAEETTEPAAPAVGGLGFIILFALEVTNLKRKFVVDDESLEDPNPNFSVDEVMGFYSVKYPELTTATVSGPEIVGEEATYTFKTTVGTKG